MTDESEMWIQIYHSADEYEALKADCDQYKESSISWAATCGKLQAELDKLKAENKILRQACEQGWGEPALINILKAQIETLAESCRACMNELIDGPTTCKEEIIRIAKAALRTDKDFMAGHIEALKEENEQLRARNAELERVSRELSASFGCTIDREGRLIKRVADLEAENKRLLKLIDEILNHALANRDTEHEFFVCYTYGGREMPEWVQKAKAALEVDGGKD